MKKVRITLDVDEREQVAIRQAIDHLAKQVGECNVSQAVRWLIREGAKRIENEA